MQPPVHFHLHDTYRPITVTVSSIRGQREARLSEYSSYGVCTIGVPVKDATGAWVSLELDLADMRRLPHRFLDRYRPAPCCSFPHRPAHPCRPGSRRSLHELSADPPSEPPQQTH